MNAHRKKSSTSEKRPRAQAGPTAHAAEAQMEAIQRAQAFIEFGLDGVVLSVNDNFLRCMGYTRDEVVGQHHRMFVEEGYARSGDYTEFWARLNRGAGTAGEFKRVAKGGRTVWIQGSYNPVLDAAGKPTRVVKVCSDVTAQKEAALAAELRNAEYVGQIAAIQRAQAFIEFSLDGTVLSANDNFLRCMGYTLDEIKGRHHRMFVEESYSRTADYGEHWAKLNRGEGSAGEFKRVGKGGRTVWISGSYNPVLDAAGKPVRVIKICGDITPQKEQAEQAEREVRRLIDAAADGNLKERARLDGLSGGYRSMCEGVNRMLDAIMAPLAEVSTVLDKVAGGDLTTPVTVECKNDLARLKGAVNGTIDGLRRMATDMRTSSEAIAQAAGAISTGTDDLSQRTEQQASSLEETASTMEEMTATVKQNAENSRQANQLAVGSRDVAEKGGEVLRKAVAAMGEINKSSARISEIINVIDEIAFQTNLLALNAAVEAARAGEQGRGFAVVAAEVRNLAQRSATAAKEIKALIKDSVTKVQDGSQLVEASGKTLEEIVTSVKRVADIIGEISAASQEQSTGIEQVNTAVTEMDEVTRRNASLVDETAAAASQLAEQADGMRKVVAAFRTGDQAPAASAVRPAPTAAAARSAAPSARPASPRGGKPGPARPAPARPVPKAVGLAAKNGKNGHHPPDSGVNRLAKLADSEPGFDEF